MENDKNTELSARIDRTFDYLSKKIIEYYDTKGKDKGMDFTHELLKFQKQIDEMKEEFDKINERVERNIQNTKHHRIANVTFK